MTDKELEAYEAETAKRFPSLALPTPPRPHGWIQWKGTSFCMNFYCDCGAQMHFDETGVYYLRCPECNKTFEIDGHVKLHPVDPSDLSEGVTIATAEKEEWL